MRKNRFHLIRDGRKTVEVRLYDEKRNRITVGDEIIFFHRDDPSKKIDAKVVGLHKAASFSELFSTDIFSKCGFGDLTVDEAVRCMRRFYTVEEEERYGVVGIEFMIT